MKKHIIWLLLVLQSCYYGDYEPMYIIINNKYGSPIACYVADGSASGFSYPDTLLSNITDSNTIHENIIDNCFICDWMDPTFKHLLSHTQQGVLSVFILNQIDANTNGWESVLSNNNYMVRYDLTVPDLDRLHQDIRFPPSALMRNVRMFPPYEEVVERYPAMVGRPFTNREEPE